MLFVALDILLFLDIMWGCARVHLAVLNIYDCISFFGRRQLFGVLESTGMHFIRCLSPNNNFNSAEFDDAKVNLCGPSTIFCSIQAVCALSQLFSIRGHKIITGHTNFHCTPWHAELFDGA